MSLATRALTSIAGFPVHLTCHVATWYWAALEATSRGLTSDKGMNARAGNIGTMPNGPQRAMLAMPRAGNVELGQGLPPIGTVLIWDDIPTHSAIVTSAGITGYNQGCVASGNPGAGHTSLAVTELGANFRSCSTIDESDIVKAAGGVFKL